MTSIPQLSLANQKWLAAFAIARGRAPRVLHIGNIANNAYNNAKLLIEVGVDSDVVCYDYYHIMGCAEWEDADFSGTVSDDFQPRWDKLDLRGFERPRWFAQGPQKLCLDYLITRRGGPAESARSERLWSLLAVATNTYRASGFLSRVWALLAAAWVKAPGQLRRVYRFIRTDRVSDLVRIYGLAPRYGGALHTAGASVLIGVWAVLRFCVLVLTGVRALLAVGVRAIRFILGRLGPEDPIAAALVAAWPISFPERTDPLTQSDLSVYRSVIERWRRLFAGYDMVIGYSTDGILPLLAGKPYFAFEHGTIREIPYRPTPEGRRTATTYRNAEHVFVTNFDCLESARTLAPGRFTLINHPFDEDHGLGVSGWQELRASLRSSLDCDLVCFFPTRHDWVPGTGYADKANDVFLRALAELRRAGLRVGAVCCEWGSNVWQSKALIADATLGSYIRWERPMAMRRFERMARACDLVVDQFKLGAFGGIVFKAMAVGAPVLTYLDEGRLLEQYREVPPVINCATQMDIVEKLGPLVRAPSRLVDLGQASRDWIKRYHGKQDTVNLQLDQFRILTMKGTEISAESSRLEGTSHG